MSRLLKDSGRSDATAGGSTFGAGCGVSSKFVNPFEAGAASKF
jgi:hypothetical protein